jgi:hypothetical protein
MNSGWGSSTKFALAEAGFPSSTVRQFPPCDSAKAIWLVLEVAVAQRALNTSFT